MQQQTKLRAGLAGAGYISEYHAAALRRLPGVELVGVHDLDRARARALAEKLGIAACGSLAELRERGADVIHVLTPPNVHAEVACQALELGCHVLVEKPLAEDVDDCRRVERLAAERGLQVAVGHSLLFDPQVRQALETVRSGKLGRVVSVDILRSSTYPAFAGGKLPPHYRAAGYPFRDLGVHALYLFQAFLGPIQDVEAQWESLGGDPNLAFDEWRALVRCRDGLGQFQLSWNVKPVQSQLIIQGARGVLRVDLFLLQQALRAALPLPSPIQRVVNGVGEGVRSTTDVLRGVAGFATGRVRPYHGLQDLVAEFYRSIETGGPVPVSIAEAVPVVDWTERVARAADADYARRVASLPRLQERPVLVTGASGALGGAIVERLRSVGVPVRAFMRRLPESVPAGMEVVLGDLGDPDAVHRAAEGVDRVIHCGAAMKGGAVEHQCATVTGTRNVLDACRKHGVEKLVHISSLSVVDWAGGTAAEPITEDSPFEPRPEERGAYTQSKLEAERLVMQYTGVHGLPSVILRPGQIFGGRIPLLTPAVARRAGPAWLVMGDGRQVLPLVHLDDVVDAVLLALRSDLRRGEVIQLVDPERWTQNRVLEAVLEPGARVVRLPRPLVLAVGKLTEPLAGALKRRSPLSAYRLRSAMAQRGFESSRARDLLGWEPRTGVSAGIERLRSRSRVPAPEPPAVPRPAPLALQED
ncbi:MAG: NAD-dependent epimerase/dehydratase family protein [Armatimonadota bacterium]